VVKIQRRDVRNLMQGIIAADQLKDKCDQHFTYALGKNRRIIRDEVDAINEAEKKAFEKYSEEEEKLSEKYSKKTEKGNVVVNQKNAGIELDPEFIYNYSVDKKKLDKKYKKELDANAAFLKEETELPLHIVLNKYFPVIECGIADFLFPMRKDLLEEEKEDAGKIKAEEEKLKKEK
jgi:hypothetical protein